MSYRIPNPAELSTRELLTQILQHGLKNQQRVRVTVPAGTARHYNARLRTCLTRSRAELRDRGSRLGRFTLRICDTYPETINGVRHETIVFAVVQSERQIVLELIESHAAIHDKKGI